MSTARVDFTRGAAERIARAVRIVEQGERDQSGPTYGKIDDPTSSSSRPVFRICAFTGSWPINTLKTVTLAFQTSTPNTLVASNLFANISVDCGTRKCAVARDGTAWFLIQANC